MYSLRRTIIIISLLLLSNWTIGQEKYSFNQDWEYTNVRLENMDTTRADIGEDWEGQFTNTEKGGKEDKTLDKGETLSYAGEMNKLKDAQWKETSLPHNALSDSLIIDKPKLGLTYYKKLFKVPSDYKGKRLSLEFEGAMQLVWIWVNDQFVKRHLGGYLPFTIDLTDIVDYGKTNSITVKLDNRAHPLVPPGKPVLDLDFLYYSGIYRDVWFHIKNPLHITDPNVIDRKAGGGVFVTYPKVSDTLSKIAVKTNIINENDKREGFDLEQKLVDAEDNVVASAKRSKQELKEGEDEHYQQNIKVEDPHLWSPDSPYLYTLKSHVIKNGEKIDSKETKIGIRSISISKETGVLLNGKPIHLEGSNRHQSYPWIGNALSNNANRRDAQIIKDAGLNSIRLSHYPQDPSFYEAADSLGILLVNPVPGWQFFNESEEFKENSFDDIRQVIRRDRNHPSVLLWEMSLNEAYPPAEYRCKQVEVAKTEWPASDSSFYTSGDSNFEKACYDVPYGDWNGDAGNRNNTTYPGHPYLMREYGDFEFGGAKSTSRQLRDDGEKALLQQAWNIQWEHNRNRQKYPRGIGDLTWAFFDGMPGVVKGIEGWGLADIKRIPKFSYYFFQSQNRQSEPMVHLANYWDKPDTTNTDKVVVYSNTDEVTLYVNDKEIARQLPDIDQDTTYGEDLTKGGHPFDGGNGNALKSPPFTFKEVPYADGKLKAVGFNDGENVAQDSVITPGEPSKISLSVDTQNVPLKADGADVVFIRAKILDTEGNPVYSADSKINFSIEGPAELVSPASVDAEAGIATVLLQSKDKSGGIKIKASSKNLQSKTLSLQSTGK